MKVAYKYYLVFFCVFVQALLWAQPNVKKERGTNFVASGDVFGTRNFIENTGVFSNPLHASEEVYFHYDHNGEKIYFTAYGLIYELWPEGATKIEEAGKEDPDEETREYQKWKRKVRYVEMRWQGTMGPSVPQGTFKQGHYFTYGGPEKNASAFKKIVYHSVYPGIDIEYTLPDDKQTGVKYTVIVRPGADPSVVRILYSGAVKKINQLENGNVEVITPYTSIIEHAPVSYFEDQTPVFSRMLVRNNQIQFGFLNTLQIDRPLIIDPYVSAVTTLTTSNYAYEVDWDFSGNAYIWGGGNSTNYYKEAKYNASGTLVWTFGGFLSAQNFSVLTYGTDFKVQKALGKSYLTKLMNTQQAVRLDANGNYDNWQSGSNGPLYESWHIEFDCQGNVVVFGGAYGSFMNISPTSGNINYTTAVVPSVTNCCQDVITKAVDVTGESYVILAGNTTYSNSLLKVTPTHTLIWSAALNNPTFNYINNHNQYPSNTGNTTNCFNGLAVNNNYVFYYDGATIAAHAKSNGGTVATSNSGLTARQQGGIAVDDCNNVYVGGIGTIKAYSFNGTSFSTLTPITLSASATSTNVFDLHMDRNNKQLYVAGAGFVGVYPAVYSQTCNAVAPSGSVCNFGMAVITATSSSITCASLGSATASIMGGTGPFSFTWQPGGMTGSVVTGLSPGTYTVTGFDQGTNLSVTNQITFTSLVPLTGTISVSGGVNCFGATTGTGAVTNLAGGSGSQNYWWSNGTNTLTAATPTGMGAGTWTVKVTDALTGCIYTETFVIYQPTQLNSLIMVSSPTACVSDSINFTSNAWGASPPYTYTWSSSATGPTAAITSTSSGVKTYSLTVKDMYQCQSITTTTVNFIPHPSLTITSPSICPLEIATVSVSGASTYTWSNNLTTPSFTASPNTTTIYTVNATALMCSSTATAAIYLKTVPVPTATNDSPRCVNQALTLTGSGGNSYLWSGPSSYTSTNPSPVIGTSSLVNNGVYNVTVTAINGCTATASTTVIINPNPTVSATSGTVCTSQTLQLNASGSAVVSFSWNGPGWTSALQNDVRANPSTTASGQYFVIGTSSAGCTGSATTMAQVIPPPSLTLTLTSPDFCAQSFNGSPATTNLSAFGATTYTLATGPALTFINNQPSFVISATAPNTTAVSVQQVTVTGHNGVCASTATALVNIKPNPVISILNPTAYICAGETYTYQITGAGLYLWSQGSIIAMNGNASQVVVKPSTTTVYTITGNQNGCASASITETLSVIPLPTLAVVPSQTEICLYSSAVMTISGNASGYYWSPPIGLQTTLGNYNVLNPIKTQTYTVVGSVASCTSAATATVVVLPLPTPFAITETPSVCVGQTVHLTAGGGVQYVWKGPLNFNHPYQEAYLSTYSGLQGGTYSVVVTDAKGCSSLATLPIKVVDPPSILPQVSQREGCVPYTTVIGVTPINGIDVNWTFRGQKIYSSSFSAFIDAAGIYTVNMQLLDVNTNCKNAYSLTIKGYEKPIADFSWLPQLPVETLDEVVFTDKSKGDIYKRIWTMREVPDFRSEESTFDYLFTLAGRFTVQLVVMNTLGCGDTTAKWVDVDSDFGCYIPNAFTPNEDRKNELYMPVLRGVKEFTLYIFDRWGHELYRTSDFNAGWDGKFNGKLVKEDTYVYKLVLTTNKNQAKTYNGWVILFH